MQGLSLIKPPSTATERNRLDHIFRGCKRAVSPGLFLPHLFGVLTPPCRRELVPKTMSDRKAEPRRARRRRSSRHFLETAALTRLMLRCSVLGDGRACSVRNTGTPCSG